MRQFKLNNKKGFTLIEMLVAVALFALVMLISTATIFSIIGGNKKAQAINAVSNNLNFAIESMVRDIKTGYGYSCKGAQAFTTAGGDGASDSFNLVSVILPDPATNHQYYVDARCLPSSAYKSITLASTLDLGTPRTVQYKFIKSATVDGYFVPGRIVKVTDTVDGQATVDLTSPEVDITDVSFFINNPEPGMGSGAEHMQPSVFILIKGIAKIAENQSSEFSVQTLVSQRILNI